MNYTFKRKLVTILSGVISGLLGHLFVLTNVLKNHDNMNYINSSGVGISSGRWLLTIIDKVTRPLFGNLNLQTLNNLLCICILAVAAYVIVLIFDLHNLLHCGIWSALFISFPTIGDTLVYSYTSHYYALAVLQTVTGVYLTIKYKFGFLAGAFLSACALGIYQAYFTLMISLFVTILICRCLREGETFLSLLKSGFFYLGTLILSLLGYFAILKILLFTTGAKLSTYQNISSMGKYKIHELPFILLNTYKSFLKIPYGDFCELQISDNPIIKVMLFALIAISLYLLYRIVKKQKETIRQTRWFLFILILIYPLAINSILLMCYHSYIYTLMVFAIVMIYLLPILLFDRGTLGEDMALAPGKAKWLQKIIAVCLIVISLIYYGQNNANYTALYYANEQSYNYWNSLVTQIKQTKGFRSDMIWAFIGKVKDPLYKNPWTDYVEMYGGLQSEQLNIYSRANCIRQFLGYNPIYATGPQIRRIRNSSRFAKMPCYPNYGSIRIIDSTVVVKFS